MQITFNSPNAKSALEVVLSRKSSETQYPLLNTCVEIAVFHK